ncbi:unnamed protein product [Notodromas monacha]|uniref:Major facilitator superfamily domain-containing protein 12 n=1 Tax=Notodromas monacha TaxID=399045 RepID=A0A7R9BVM6_9CRUS|nr:unnamed protein product [Notodromas monacha]CAG0922614.1 unnamed protein product [Notodromas monacha]
MSGVREEDEEEKHDKQQPEASADHDHQQQQETPSSGRKEVAKLSWRIKVCYGLGHVWNDLCASLWFTYLLLFLKFALGFDDNSAGVLMLVGQVADAVATPLAGLQLDKKYSAEALARCCNYGHRKTWHLIGRWARWPMPWPRRWLACSWTRSTRPRPWLAAATTAIARPGISSIAHLSLIPCLTHCQHQRTELNAIRYGFTVLANMAVYIIAWIVLGLADRDGGEGNTRISKQDTTSFRNISLISSGIGALFTLLFHIGVREEPLATRSSLASAAALKEASSSTTTISSTSAERSPSGTNNKPTNPPAPPAGPPANISLISSGIGALFTLLFHIGVREEPLATRSSLASAAALKEASSSTTTISSTSAERSPSGTAINTNNKPTNPPAPPAGPPAVRRVKFYEWFCTREFYEVGWVYQTTRLLFNVSQVYMTLYLQETLSLGPQSVAIIPLVMFCSGLAATLFLKWLNQRLGRKPAFTIGFSLGMAAAIWIWTGGTARTQYKEASQTNGGFIYGAMSFADKMASGLAIMLIQYLNPCQNAADCPASNPFPGTTLVVGCGGSALLGMLGVLVMKDYNHDVGLFQAKPTPQAVDPGKSCSYSNPAYKADVNEESAVSAKNQNELSQRDHHQNNSTELVT